jgi:asparagine synthase (glutamine-hydrolysing)
MCGIAGIFSTDKAPSQAWLHRMVGTLSHRGPDSVGFHADPPVALGHARLSIIDLESGQQPIHNEDRTVWVVLNGEIFNYIELRADLEKQGHRFYTRSDTEVLVHLYEEYGCDLVEKLNGQFAFALWDSMRVRLMLARDRAGIRPLFYSRVGNTLLFGSEIKSLLACPIAPRRLSAQALGEIFTYWAPLGDKTSFEGIYSLGPGHYLVQERESVRTVCYWDWTFPSRADPVLTDADAAAEELRALLVDAVRLQLRADVPVGAYLSGGLDSSAIAALIKHYTKAPLRTFSISFEDGEFDESEHQRSMADSLQTQHTTLRCNAQSIRDGFPKTIWHTETPILRTAPTPLMLLSAAVRASGYKVVLTGEGADEVFGGYDLFKEAKIRRFWARQPQSLWRPRLFERLYPYLRHSPGAQGAFALRFFGQGMEHGQAPYFAHMPRWSTTKRIWQFLSSDVRAALRNWNPLDAVSEIVPEESAAWRALNRDQYVEAHTLLTGYLLSSQGDRVAMANSVEARVPFLDHRVIEFGNRLAPKLKLCGLNEKYVLKRAVRDIIPETIIARPKQPYRAPESNSFFVEGKAPAYVDDLLSDSRIRQAGYFEPKAVRRLIEKCRKGGAIGFSDNMAFVGILSTMMLDELFVRTVDVGVTPARGHSASLGADVVQHIREEGGAG